MRRSIPRDSPEANQVSTRTPRRMSIVAVVAVVLLAMVSSGCATDADDTAGASTDSATSTDGTLVVGSVASMTGSAQPYGVSQQAGTELAVSAESAATDVPLRLESADDASTAQTGTEAFNRLISVGASAILGPTLSPVAAVTDPLAQAVGVPVLAVTNTTLDIGAIGDLVWRVTLSERAMIPQTLEVARDLRGVTSAVIVEDGTDDYSRGAAAAYRAGVDAVGIDLLDDITFDPASLDAGGWRQLVAQAAATGADALLLAARSDPAVQLLVAAEAEAITATLVGGNGFNAPDVLSGAGSAADGLLVSASWNPAIDEPESQAFVAAYTARYGTTPDAFAAQGYAGVELLIAAAEAGGGTSRQALATGLTQLGTVDTVLGQVRFEGREAVYGAAVQEVRDGTLGLLARGNP